MNLNQVTLPVTDVARSIAFYELLGLNCIVHTHDDYARLELPKGEATLSLSRVTQVPSGPGIKIYFELDNLDDKVTYLLSQGLIFDQKPTDQPWLWREAHLKDPDANQIVLYRAGSNRKNPPWRKKD